MDTIYEICGRFEEASDCDRLLYAPLKRALSYRESKVYRFRWQGEDEAALRAFAERCLLDRVSQVLLTQGEAPWRGFAFCLEYGMKTSVLDLEKEAILSYYRSLNAPAFRVEGLFIRRRIYVFGDAGSAEREVLVRDLVNPAIHEYRLLDQAGVALA